MPPPYYGVKRKSSEKEHETSSQSLYINTEIKKLP
jgi:hypothetical protein